jgi:hypothetical protein
VVYATIAYMIYRLTSVSDEPCFGAVQRSMNLLAARISVSSSRAAAGYHQIKLKKEICDD